MNKKQIFEDLRNLYSEKMKSHKNPHSEYVESVWKLDIPEDRTCPQYRDPPYKHRATDSCGFSICNLCGCRAKWYFFGEKDH